ncbi:diguanylate cyclase [Solidesulfovibrio carbinoliphilus subsp. oakridgensis]|uniref:diguanylate cyclase n=1 Tax=Solidesulfovibrio carbinoliphilus subsp. oakridgensis TaxID=694327 RepID=G7Q959_9BACT|nr:GGDEF domain-containing protein [Solidesulfovibrio carbinoliphilus]EHJ47781.1 diguanylate cyclase [Solidesulfovibrio carbinoliphilus subsp. oakridgensis]
MPDFLSLLHAPTMVLMVVVLYAALSLVLVYAYACRRTYPGFGAMTLGQVLWFVGIFLNFYRVLGETPSLFAGNALMLVEAVLVFHGLARYGQIGDIRLRSGLNVVLYGLAMVAITHYLFIDYNTCRRAAIYSAFCAIVFGRISLEPYLTRNWRTYATQGLFSGFFFVVAALFAVRTVLSLQAVDCPTASPDHVAKLLLLVAMLCSPFFVFSILAMTSSRVEAELGEARDELRHLAETDGLTGLPNRRHFLRLAGEALDRAREQGFGVSLVMLDLDNFKTVNDTHGHQTGDRVLMGVGRCLAGALPAPGRVGRLGGEEFGVLLPGVSGPAAVAMAERLRRSLEALRPDGLAVTASFGVAEGDKDVDALLALADECLYAAKRAGRNRVEPQPVAVAATGP